MNKTELIEVKFNLPLDSNKLRMIELFISSIRKELLHISGNAITSRITIQSHENLYERTVFTLDLIGRLSVPIFAIRDELEEKYERRYYKSPNLARKLFNDHYSSLHEPYTTLKNECYILLDDIDREYMRKYGEKPKNWMD